MREKQVSVAEKMAMVSLASSDWQGSNNPENDELFQALISLIQHGAVTAFYDDNDGCVKYQSNPVVSSEPRKFYWACDPE